MEAVAEYRKLCPYHLDADEPLFRGARGGQLEPAIIQREMREAALARSTCRRRRRRMRCAIPSPRICSAGAAICAPSRNCSAMPACRPRRSIPASTPTRLLEIYERAHPRA